MNTPSTEPAPQSGGAPADVRHDPQASRFSVPLGDDSAVAEYERRGDTITFTHTIVPSEHEGQGIGGRLARAAMDHARRERLQVVPQCPFIAAWVKRHPDYHDIVHPDWRDQLAG